MNTENKKTALALGAFDGLHLGHKAVIEGALKEKEKGLSPVILLFSEHPLKTLAGKSPGELFLGETKERELKRTGCATFTVNFPDIKDYDPEKFFLEILIKRLNAKSISCGFNYKFGKNGEGNVDVLKKLSEKYKVDLFVAESVDFEGEPISSTRIRKCLKSGEIKKANEMLGRFYSYSFKIEKGDGIGEKILSIPTVNQSFNENFTVPLYGVYASCTSVLGNVYPSVTNIGVRPTVDGNKLRSETHILNFKGDIYDKTAEVFLIDYMRPEIKFNNLNDLKSQMEKDKKKAALISSPALKKVKNLLE